MNGTYLRWFTRPSQKMETMCQTWNDNKTEILCFVSEFSILWLTPFLIYINGLCDCPDKSTPGIFSNDTSFYLNKIFLTINKEATKIVFWFKKLTSTQNNKSTFFIKLLWKHIYEHRRTTTRFKTDNICID